MRGFAPNTLISQPEHLPRSDFRDCYVGHVEIFSSVSLSENRPENFHLDCNTEVHFAFFRLGP